MKFEEMEILTEKFFNNKINKHEEKFFFDELSQNEKAREYFKNTVFLKDFVKHDLEKYPEGLDKKIYDKIYQKNSDEKFESRSRGILFKISIAASILFLFVSLYFLNETKRLQDNINRYSSELQEKSNTVEQLYSNLDATTVYANYPNEIIIE